MLGPSRKKGAADINCRDSEGWTALHHASWNGNLNFLNILLYNDAQIEIKDKSGVNALTLSVARGHNEITHVLLNAGADFTSKDSRGNTPMHYAAVQNNKKCLELMISKGANLDTHNEDGLTPLDMSSPEFRTYFAKSKKSSPRGSSGRPTTNQSSRQARNSRRSNNIPKQPRYIDYKKIDKEHTESSDKVTVTSQASVGKKENKIQNMSTRIEPQGINSGSETEPTIGPKDFKVHAILGKGSFGEVYLVEKIDDKKIYAMKVLYKNNIIKHNLTRYALTEKNVLSNLNHPFIVKLHYSFQTPSKLFMILDFCPGGDLGEHLQVEHRFTEDRAKIYICEIITALEHLHKHNIIYRDLKPDNIVLDIDGHAMLTDFGLSKEEIIGDNSGAKSFCGSVAYLAPEMLKRKGHGKAVDWYLLGVVLYEMLVGLPPYYAESKDELFKNIECAELRLPSRLSSEVKDLLQKLLERNPSNRLGSGLHGARDIKNHSWFQEIMWEAVIHRKMKPPKKRKKIKLSKKNIPQDLFSGDKQGKDIEDWTFIEPSTPQ